MHVAVQGHPGGSLPSFQRSWKGRGLLEDYHLLAKGLDKVCLPSLTFSGWRDEGTSLVMKVGNWPFS